MNDGGSFESIKPDYDRNCFDVVLRIGRKKMRYAMAFSCFKKIAISSDNKVVKLKIDATIRKRGAFITLADGSKTDFPSDYVLYHCEPKYEWSPLNQIKKFLKDEKYPHGLALEVVEDALKTAPLQVARFLKTAPSSERWRKLGRLVRQAGYAWDVRLRKVA